MSGERQAQAARKQGECGYYVRNHRTRIVVAGPYDAHGTAQREAAARNRDLPVDERLEVVLVGPDPMAGF